MSVANDMLCRTGATHRAIDAKHDSTNRRRSARHQEFCRLRNGWPTVPCHVACCLQDFYPASHGAIRNGLNLFKTSFHIAAINIFKQAFDGINSHKSTLNMDAGFFPQNIQCTGKSGAFHAQGRGNQRLIIGKG